MESLNLFDRLERLKGENVLTEALCIVLNKSKAFRREFLAKARVRQRDVLQIKTQQVDTNIDGKGNPRPDLWVFMPRGFVLFEIKEDDDLSYGQWKKYESILVQDGQDPSKYLFGLVAPWTRVDSKIIKKGYKDKIWWWSDVYRMAEKAKLKEKQSDQVASFLLEEFTAFLEVRGMKPFDGFSKKDMILLQGLHSVSGRIQALFHEIVNDLKRSKMSVKSSGYEVSTYKHELVLYPGITIEVDSNGHRLKGWIGFECASGKLPFSLVVWADDMGKWKRSKSQQTRKLEKVLNGQGFIWDKNEGYYRNLKASLHSADQSRDAAKAIAREARDILANIFNKL